MINDKQKNILIPKLRFPEFKDSGEWEVKTIGRVAKVTAGGTPSSSEPKYWGGNIPWMNSGELNLKRIYSVANFITEIGLKESSTKKIPPLCVLIGLAGQGKTRGTAAINYIELCTNQSIAAIHPNELKFNSEFLYHKIDSMYKDLRQLSTGQGGRGGLNLSIIKEIKIPFPSLAEQQKIASCLSSLDELLEAHKQKLELLKQRKKGLMQNLFPESITNYESSITNKKKNVPKLRFPEFKDSGEWEYLNGNKLFDSISNKNHNSDLPVLAITQEHGAIPRELIDYTVIVSKKSVINYKIVEIGDFIISLRTFQGGIEYSNYKGICSPAYIILRKKVKINDIFYKYYFKTPLYIRQLNKNLEGIRDGKMVSYKQFSEILLPFPSLAEQQKIAECLLSVDEIITAEAEKIEQLEKHKKGLMQGLFPITN